MNDENNQTNTTPNQQENSQPPNTQYSAQPSSTIVNSGFETVRPKSQTPQSAAPQVSQPSITTVNQSQQSMATHQRTQTQHKPMPGQMQAGMSASQMGYNQPKKNTFDINPKQLIIKGIIVLVILGGVFTALLMSNTIALSEFKSVGYTNSKGASFQLDFYSKHGSKQLNSGNKQLVSKVSKDGKFPIALSISTTNEMAGYNRAKDCTSFTKVFDVQNNNLNQKISVCDFGKQSNLPAGGVYIAGFIHNNQAHILTIGQDYSDINLSSQSGAQESLTKFGMGPYKADIERIVSSIKID